MTWFGYMRSPVPVGWVGGGHIFLSRGEYYLPWRIPVEWRGRQQVRECWVPVLASLCGGGGGHDIPRDKSRDGGPYRLSRQGLLSCEILAIRAADMCTQTIVITHITPGRLRRCSSRPMPSPAWAQTATNLGKKESFLMTGILRDGVDAEKIAF